MEKSFAIKISAKLKCNNCGAKKDSENFKSMNIQASWENDGLTGKPAISVVCNSCEKIGFITFPEVIDLLLVTEEKNFRYLSEEETKELEKNIEETQVAHSKH